MSLAQPLCKGHSAAKRVGYLEAGHPSEVIGDRFGGVA